MPTKTTKEWDVFGLVVFATVLKERFYPAKKRFYPAKERFFFGCVFSNPVGILTVTDRSCWQDRPTMANNSSASNLCWWSLPPRGKIGHACNCYTANTASLELVCKHVG